MKIKKQFLLVLSVVAGVFCSCSPQEKSEDIYVFDVEEAVENIEEIPLSKYASSIEYIPLGVGDSVYLSRTQGMTLSDEYIFVLANLHKTIHLFSKEGKFIRNIGHKGRAEGEFLGVRKMTYFPESRVLEVATKGKFLTFSVEDGKYLRSFDFNDLADQFLERYIDDQEDRKRTEFDESLLEGLNIGDGNYLFIAVMPYVPNPIYAEYVEDKSYEVYALVDTLHQITTLEKKKLTFIRRNGSRGRFPEFSRMYKLNGETNIILAKQDTLLVLKNKKLEPKMVIRSGKYSNNDNNWNEADFVFLADRDMGYVESLEGLFVTAQMPTYKCIYASDKREVNIVYDKAERKTRIVKFDELSGSAGLKNDLDSGMPFWPTGYANGIMFTTVEADLFIELSEKYNSPKMKEVAAKLTPDSNPVVVVVKK